MAVNLFTPIVNSRTPAVNFFNGRLLSGEDLTTEHQSNRAARALLGKAIGSGVVYGLNVSEAVKSSSPQAPVLTVTQGLALNRNGGALLLDADTDIALTQPATAAATSTVFQPCTPTQTGVYVAGAGAYLLVVGPASAAEGLAQVNGTSVSTAPCNTDYQAYGVQFRLVQIDLAAAVLNDPAHLQNAIAYQCFGLINWDNLLLGSFVAPEPPFGLIDQMRQSQLLTDCELPLAVLYWTADQGIAFIDTWSVRRRIVQPPAVTDWALFAGDRRSIEGESMFLQFQDQISELTSTQSNLSSIGAGQYFNYLPPVGILPLAGVAGADGFTYQSFFVTGTYKPPVFIPAARMEGVVRTAMSYRPVNAWNNEAVWLYQVVEGATVLPYLIFTSIYAPFQGSAQFDLSNFDFSNFV
jgi:hypothetical protein